MATGDIAGQLLQIRATRIVLTHGSFLDHIYHGVGQGEPPKRWGISGASLAGGPGAPGASS